MEFNGVVKVESNDDEFVVKYPSEDFRLGTQVAVNTSQIAFFCQIIGLHRWIKKKHFEI